VPDSAAVRLDVTNPPPELFGSADVIICSEVMEHVVAPVQRGFDGLFALLKPGGTLVFTVPYWLEPTAEHFPNLHDWHIEQRDGERVLVNLTAEGTREEFSQLRFHGGGADVLEMRVFGLEDLIGHLERAGFADIRVRQESVLDYGICFRYNWGLPITARRPHAP
jgi:SAM-dependent methyltransferase